MKKITYSILTILIIGLVSYSCDELFGDLVNFDGEYYVMDFTVEPTELTGIQVFDTETFDSELDTILAEYGLDRESLDLITLAEALVEVTSPDVSFDFINTFEVVIEGNDVEAKLIAWQDSIPEGVSTLTLMISEDDIKDFLFAEQFTLTTQGFVNAAVTEAINLQAKVKFHFKGAGTGTGLEF